MGAKTGVFSEKIHGTKKPNKVAESVRQERGNRKVKTKHLKFNEEDLKYSSLLKTPNWRSDGANFFLKSLEQRGVCVGGETRTECVGVVVSIWVGSAVL